MAFVSKGTEAAPNGTRTISLASDTTLTPFDIEGTLETCWKHGFVGTIGLFAFYITQKNK